MPSPTNGSPVIRTFAFWAVLSMLTLSGAARDARADFTSPFVSIPMYDGTAGVILQDWNGDGCLDLSAVGDTYDRVSTLVGTGHGSFGARTDFVSDISSPLRIAAGNVLGSSLPDMVISQFGSDEVRIYAMVAGPGISFSQTLDLDTGDGPFDVAVGDLDQDGDQDIVTANFNANTISVLKNNGDGTFAAHVDYATGTNPRGVELADVTQDGRLDVITGNEGGSITIWKGTVLGTLADRVDKIVGWWVSDVAVAQLVGSSHPDVVVSIMSGFQGIGLFIGNGTPALFDNVAYVPGIHGIAIMTGNFDNDALPDVAVAGAVSGLGTLYPGALFELTGSNFPFHTAGVTSTGMSSGDLDGDGNLDLALASYPALVSILRGNGDGTFGTTIATEVAQGEARRIASAEMTGDSWEDVVLGTHNAIRIEQGDGTGAFQTLSSAAAYPVEDLALADVDQDGDRDVISVSGSVGPGNILVYRNQGDGTLGNVAGYDVPYALAVSAIDLDHDTDADLVVGGGIGLHVLLNAGNGTFGSPVNYAVFGDVKDLEVRDLDGDTHPDVAMTDLVNSAVEIRFGNGSGGFGPPVSYPTANGPVSIAIADLEGDADLDLVIACKDADAITIRRNNGTGVFTTTSEHMSPGNPSIVLPGFPVLGETPFLVLNEETHTMSYWTPFPGGYSAQRMDGLLPVPVHLAADDVNHDDKVDVVAVFGTGPTSSGIQTLLHSFPTPPDAAPVVTAPAAVSVEAGGFLTLTVTADDNCDPITSFTGSGAPSGATFTPNGSNTSGTFSFNPTLSQVGEYSVTFTASNALSGSRTTVVHVEPPGTDAAGTFVWTPQPGDEGTYLVCFIADNFEDPPDTACTTITVTPPAGATPPLRAPAGLEGLGVVNAPSAPTKGPVVSVKGVTQVAVGQTLALDVTATDTDLLTSDTAELPPGNDATFTSDQSPVVGNIPGNISAASGVPIVLQISAFDPDGDPILGLSASYPGLPPGHNASFVADTTGSSGTFTWTPDPGLTGTFGVTFTAANRLVGMAGTIIHVGKDLVGYWRLNGDGKDIAAGDDFVISPATLFETGQLGECLVNDGSSSVGLSAPATQDHAIVLGQPWTVECWTKVEAPVASVETYLVAADNFFDQSWRLIHKDGFLGLDVNSGGTTSSVFSTNPVVLGTEWHHVAVTTEGALLYLYIDGALNNVSLLNSGAATSSGSILVGWGADVGFRGMVDEVRIWRSQRSQQELLTHMNVELPGYATGAEPVSPVYRDALLQNRPNPFNPRTEIVFELAQEGRATLRVFDVSGRVLRTLVEGSRAAGPHRVVWDGRDAQGRKLASGAYFYRLEAGGFAETKRMILLK